MAEKKKSHSGVKAAEFHWCLRRCWPLLKTRISKLLREYSRLAQFTLQQQLQTSPHIDFAECVCEYTPKNASLEKEWNISYKHYRLHFFSFFNIHILYFEIWYVNHHLCNTLVAANLFASHTYTYIYISITIFHPHSIHSLPSTATFFSWPPSFVDSGAVKYLKQFNSLTLCVQRTNADNLYLTQITGIPRKMVSVSKRKEECVYSFFVPKGLFCTIEWSESNWSVSWITTTNQIYLDVLCMSYPKNFSDAQQHTQMSWHAFCPESYSAMNGSYLCWPHTKLLVISNYQLRNLRAPHTLNHSTLTSDTHS